jgi:hypothetical protein
MFSEAIFSVALARLHINLACGGCETLGWVPWLSCLHRFCNLGGIPICPCCGEGCSGPLPPLSGGGGAVCTMTSVPLLWSSKSSWPCAKGSGISRVPSPFPPGPSLERGPMGGPHSPPELEACSPVPVVVDLEIFVMLVLAVECLHLSLNLSIRQACCACPTDLSQVCCRGLCQEAVFKCLLEQTLKPSPDFSFSAQHLQT